MRGAFLCLLLLTARLAPAQPLLSPSPPQSLPQRTLNFEYLDVKDGLVQETVTAIVQDRQGFMWFGSQHGLSRFDGYRFTDYQAVADDTRSLADNWVQALYVDERNRLWVGTRAGLQRFDQASGGFTRFVPAGAEHAASAKRTAQAIIGDGAGGLWIATNDGLQHFDPASGRFAIFRHDPEDPASLADNRINTLALDSGGNLWLGMKGRLDRLASGTARFEHFRIEAHNKAAAAYNEVQQLWVDRRNQLWIGTPDGLLTWSLGPNIAETHRFGPSDGLQPGMITAFLQDREGNLWLGTNTHGLHRWDQERRRFVAYPSDPKSVAGNEVSALYEDSGGTLWVGTWTAGVKHVDLASGGFNRYYHVAGNAHTLSDNRIYGMCPDGEGRLLLATFGGIDLLDPASGETRNLHADTGMQYRLHKEDIVLALYRDGRGRTWAGTSAGFSRFDPVNGVFVSRPYHLADPNSNSVTHITSDADGALWISTRGGLRLLDPDTGRETLFRHDPDQPHSLSDDWVKMTLEDKDGAVWVATDDGLNRYDRARKSFTQFHHDPEDVGSLSSDRVQYLFQDGGGTLWVGTNAGLNRVERGPGGAVRFRSYAARDGLIADSIGGILEDEAGRLWLSTVAGISRFDPKTGSVRNYSARDGMIEGYYFSGSAYRDADGTMYFGGANGLTAFKPATIRDNPTPPPVVITDLLVSGQPLHGLPDAVQDTRAVTLAYDQSAVAVEFSALAYAEPQRNRFRYRLEGFDRAWTETDAGKRVASYTNLEPGHYVFRVKAANKDGVWNDAGAALAITITPPVWKTWWFRTLAAAAALLALWMTDRARARLHRDQKAKLEALITARTSEVLQQKNIVESKNRELQDAHRNLQEAQQQLQHYLEDRERLFMSISHDLRSPITRLILRSELLEDDELREEFYDDLDDLDMMVKSALQSVKDTDIHENVTEVSLDSLIRRVLRGAQLSGHKLAYTECGVTVQGKPLALKRAIGNLVDNALCYGKDVEIEVEDCGARVDIRIRDHGPGVPEAALRNLASSYVRLEHGRKQNASGLGLGLSIARGVAEAHGGQLLLENHPGGGLLATIRLPQG